MAQRGENTAIPADGTEERFRSVFCAKRQNAILALVMLGGGILIAVGCDGEGAARQVAQRSDNAGQPSLPLITSKSRLNLGEVRAGGQKQSDFWLTNRTASPVEVAEIETSCDCLTIDLPRRIVSPTEKVAGHVLLDLWREPRFTGQLGIEVRGKEKSGKLVFSLMVKVNVERE